MPWKSTNLSPISIYNKTDITHRVIENGEFHRKKIQKTLSDAINIEVVSLKNDTVQKRLSCNRYLRILNISFILHIQPYNFERIAFYITGGNHDLVKEWMLIMEQTQQLTLDTKWLARLKKDFRSARVTDDEMCTALRQAHATLSYVADPHTAIAMAAAEKLGYVFTTETSPEEEMMPMAILATASPCKFQEVVTVALGEVGWKRWEEDSFPPRAQNTLQKEETEPYHYPQKEGSSLSEVQSEWRKMMIDIVNNNF